MKPQATYRRNSRLHPKLVASEKAITAALSIHRRLVREVQQSCQHEVVYHADYEPSRSGLFSAMPAHRLCVRCGLEEAGGITTDHFGFQKLRTLVTIKLPSLMVLFALRVRGANIP